MLDTTCLAVEGWYPDPSGRLAMRFWNGDEWTAKMRGNDAWATPGTEASSASDRPETGWAGIAFALHSAISCPQPVQVTVSFPSASELTVNTFDHSYVWRDEPHELPRLDGPAEIVFEPCDTSAEHGRNLDGLLWRISAEAFADRTAPWMHADDLYRLDRWPNLTTIQPELDDMRQAAMLANGMFTVDELAGFSDRSFAATRSLINALSLMNTLKVATLRNTGAHAYGANPFGTGAPQQFGAAPTQTYGGLTTGEFGARLARPQPEFAAAAPAATTASVPKQGLFQRLRSRLGL